MPEKRSKTPEGHETPNILQPVVLFLLAAFGLLLLLAPFLPVLITNLVYSLSGDRPKIYWYLARSAGFITLSILWLSMALGLGLTNKLARRWPGAPAAFAIHQYVSLLGLAFSVYHALVLMGDHFVDFSLPRLLTPFSIEYERFWVGLGQTGFYIWLIVVLSFYVRQRIGQATWRLIHYANFVIYAFGMLHGIFSGTDSKFEWAQAYYWLSGTSLLVLLAYRLYQVAQSKRAPSTKRVRPAAQPGQQIPAPAPVPATAAVTSVPVAAAPQPVSPSVEPAMAVGAPAPAIRVAQADKAEASPAVVSQPAPVSAANAVAAKTQPARISPEPKTTPVHKPAPDIRVTRLPRGSGRPLHTPSAQQHPEPARQVNAAANHVPQVHWRKVYIGGVRSKIDQAIKKVDTSPLMIWFQENPPPGPDPSPSLS